MLLLVSGASKTVRKHANSKHLGCLLTPQNGNTVDSFGGLPWAADNGCFNGFNPVAFVRMLEKIRDSSPIFIATPDVVAEAAATLELFMVWAPVIRWYEFPVALVLQNGQEFLPVPWDQVNAVFIGGDTTWKLGPAARRLVHEARQRGKWVHMGRVNSLVRLGYARDIGCQSVDGSGYSMFPDTNIPEALRFLEAEQTVLEFGEVV
ncbi:MAG: hypothetical protein J7639_24705 [Paenibacillaceae bacterium]|nr:hypothetical protein [Paenibacillaceae bacterium]